MIALAAQHENGFRHAVIQTNISSSAFNSLLSNPVDCCSVLGVRRFELADSKPSNNRINSFAEPSIHLALNGSRVGPVKNFTPHILDTWNRSQFDNYRFSRPVVGAYVLGSRFLHSSVNADFGHTSDDAKPTAYSYSDNRDDDDCNHYYNKKSKHRTRLLLEAGFK